MSSVIFVAVILAAFLHAVWNAMVKKMKDKYIGMSGIVFGHLPASIVIIFLTPIPAPESIPFIILSAIIHNGYQWFLLNSYKFGDYTKVYPVARGAAPILVTIISLFFLGTVLSNFEIIGIFTISAGILSLSYFDKKPFKDQKEIIYALTTATFIMGYSITDGIGAKISNSFLSYMGWSFILNAIIFSILLSFIGQKKIITKTITKGKFIFLIGGTTSYIVYGIVVWAFTKAPIPIVATLRETSIIFALLIGNYFLKEKFTFFKMVAVLTIFCGVLLLNFF